MSLSKTPKRHRFPVSIISQAVWLYYRFNHNYRDVQEQLAFRRITLSHETVRKWCIKFALHFRDVIKKHEREPSNKWHLDEIALKINGEMFVLWRAVDSDRRELDVFPQKRRNKKSAIRFLSRLLGTYPAPRVIGTDKLKSYVKPIQFMCRQANHRIHKRLNNRIDNAHQPTRRKEKCLIKFKSALGVQRLLSLMGKVRNIFSVEVGRYEIKHLISDLLSLPPRLFGWRRLYSFFVSKFNSSHPPSTLY
ncbi:IS6 family transposase [Candidatus Odyssella thessalonicensis]|uniref:IS6 family transposase n=1 Tax=Candidatus Odyssella thessalonicensis TaxID=84647 RepID=UPI000225AC7C|nr:IS6 family transposase [Candidatus Odyssella thessalonicensis]